MKKLFNLLLISALSFGVTYARSREERSLDNFNGIGFGPAGTLVLEQGNAYSVVLEGDDDYIGETETTVRGDSFRLNDLDVNISGSGTCSTLVEDKLVARVSASGDVYYSGSPSVDARISGSGRVRKN